MFNSEYFSFYNSLTFPKKCLKLLKVLKLNIEDNKNRGHFNKQNKRDV